MVGSEQDHVRPQQQKDTARDVGSLVTAFSIIFRYHRPSVLVEGNCDNGQPLSLKKYPTGFWLLLRRISEHELDDTGSRVSSGDNSNHLHSPKANPPHSCLTRLFLFILYLLPQIAPTLLSSVTSSTCLPPNLLVLPRQTRPSLYNTHPHQRLFLLHALQECVTGVAAEPCQLPLLSLPYRARTQASDNHHAKIS